MKINYRMGQRINGVVFLKIIDPYIYPNGKISRKALFICPYCQNNFKVCISQIKNGHTKSCGCYKTNQDIKRLTTHGLSKHVLYKIWGSMKKRCSNSGDPNYKNYGLRGINVCEEWLGDFKLFYDWCMANGYKKGLQIDRKDNDGNYTPDNCRFVTSHIQATNQRIQKSNTSGFTGVSWQRNINKWFSYIVVNRNRSNLGYFVKKQDAVQSRNDFIIKNNLTEYKIQKILWR